MPRMSGPSSSPRRAESCRFQKSVACIIATSAARRISAPYPAGLHRHQGTPPVLLSFFLATARKPGGLRIPVALPPTRLGVSPVDLKMLPSESGEVLAKDRPSRDLPAVTVALDGSELCPASRRMADERPGVAV